MKRINWNRIYNSIFLKAILLISVLSWIFTIILYDNWRRPWPYSCILGIVISVYVFLLVFFLCYLKWKIVFLLFILILPLFIPTYSSFRFLCKIENSTDSKLTIFVNYIGSPNTKKFVIENHQTYSFFLIPREMGVNIYPLVAFNEEGELIYKTWIILPSNEKRIVKIVIK